ncbi:MAG: serine hydrolase domain-containing protein [Thermoanaerobaculia bacterium]|nr:serine hydrolase domain-containing protein [Thermoanaerobaculia bacterium]
MLAAALAAVAALPGHGQAPAVDDLAPRLAASIAEGDVPALAAAVFDSASLVAIGVAGVRKLGDATEVTVDDRWHIGSISKSFTATLAARYVDRGELAWEARLELLLPDPFAGSVYADATLDQLLSHRSGMVANLPMPDFLRFRTSRDPLREQRRQALETLAVSEPVTPPGEGFLYSNAGFLTVGAALERLGDRPWEELVQVEVLEPLEVVSAGFGAPGAGSPDELSQPWGHVAAADGSKRTPIRPGPLADNPPMLGPAGTLHMTIADLAAWGREHLRGERGMGTLLTTETYRRLHRGRGDNYAYGWVDEVPTWSGGRRAVWHNGSNTMWYAVVAFVPEADLGVAVTTNGSLRRAGTVHAVVASLFEAYTTSAGGGR